MDGILGRIDAVINGPTPNLSSHLINYDGRSHSRERSLTHTGLALGLGGRWTFGRLLVLYLLEPRLGAWAL